MPRKLTDKIQELISRCKCGVSVEVNEHRNYYDSASKYMDELFDPDIDTDIKEKMIETDTIICIQFYPHTPIGFHIIYHYDLDIALDDALKVLSDD
jgi:hypothetical protein